MTTFQKILYNMQHTFTSLEERSLIKLYTVDGEERERLWGHGP